jgi:hypothetical protein
MPGSTASRLPGRSLSTAACRRARRRGNPDRPPHHYPAGAQYQRPAAANRCQPFPGPVSRRELRIDPAAIDVSRRMLARARPDRPAAAAAPAPPLARGFRQSPDRLARQPAVLVPGQVIRDPLRLVVEGTPSLRFTASVSSESPRPFPSTVPKRRRTSSGEPLRPRPGMNTRS